MKLLFLLFSLLMTSHTAVFSQIKVGAERISEILIYTKGKRVGITTNHTAVLDTPQKTHLIDTLLSHGVDIEALYTPEHGLRGNYDAGVVVESGYDSKTKIVVHSLYGKSKRPTRHQLKDIDLMIFDIQDVGVRFYTYISTMYYVMDACAEYAIPMLILDRPNPHDTIDGAVMKDNKYRSFVSLLPIPAVHGLTLGEAALMINGERWLSRGRTVPLSVLPVIGWKHGDPYSLPLPPSPNLRSDKAIALYPTICYLEACSWSEGRGTDHPFEQVGYPNSRCGEHSFIPTSMPGASSPKYKNKKCYGPSIVDYRSGQGIDLDLLLRLSSISKQNNITLISKPKLFDLLAGNSQLRRQINKGMSATDIRKSWQKDLDEYKKKRAKYILYEDYTLTSTSPR
ncbi:DUF1343 domain-containing protein [Porphyromonas sp.]|uniref:exo-beta-N-acetylmuramidase NamZ family protein n=1 Tax=Porphyromonas sp. TaxID=1924944 RepID=UPI0026DD436D|nr:DUF1343 domain-containing protein [Porphyromonas sp.]MDO4695129.1 DUF1343 domain-containing protein [Porphyromonas sp.]MDO4770227.1 DUF1343 domain-containing protein [Porphyromonas sp.]